MAEIQGISSHNASFVSGAKDGSSARSATGSLSNLSFKVDDSPFSKLANVAEELTFARDNSKQTKLANRKQKQVEDSLAEKIRKLQELMQLSVKDKGKAENLITKYKQHRDLKELIQNANELHGGAAEAYALLLSASEEEADPEEKLALKKAADALMSSNKEDILAVLNTISEAQASFEGQELKVVHIYSNVVSSFKEPVDMLIYIEKNFSGNFEKGLDFLVKALGSDLQAATPSHEKVALESIALGLDQVRILNSGRMHLEHLLSRLDTVHNLDISVANSTQMLRRLVDLSSVKFITYIDVSSLVSNIKAPDPEKDVLIAQELFSALRNCSSQLFGGDEKRMAVLDAAQKLVDEKIAKEDEWLAMQ